MAADVAVEVPRWAVHEIALTADTQPANPYTQVELVATLRGPDGVARRVRGFWDGERGYRVRVAPTVAGDWSWATTSTDTSLDGRAGAFRCVAPAAGAAGFVRRDAQHPAHFVRDNGDRYFMCGQTYYGLSNNAAAGGDWRAAIDGSRAYGMNKVRLLVHGVAGHPSCPHPPTSPFDGDHDRLDLAHWRALDGVVEYLHERGMVAELILFVNRAVNSGLVFGTWEQDARYLRHALARYAAYPGVIWCLTNEWNYTGKDRDYWDALGRLARDEDPWAREGEQRRPLTIHQQTRIDWQFGDATWPTHACLQYGVRNGQRTRTDEWEDDPHNRARYPHGDDWGNAGVVHNVGHGLPVVNDECGYIGEPEDRSAPGNPPLTRAKHRRVLWGIYAAGGYASVGDKATHGDERPYMGAGWRDAAEYGDIRRLVQLFTARGLTYWRMASRNDLVTEGARAYALAEPGRQYLVYAAVGGPIALDLAPGAYRARRYDPRTGAEVTLSTVAGGGTRHFALPAGDDWVLMLSFVPDDL